MSAIAVLGVFLTYFRDVSHPLLAGVLFMISRLYRVTGDLWGQVLHYDITAFPATNVGLLDLTPYAHNQAPEERLVCRKLGG